MEAPNDAVHDAVNDLLSSRLRQQIRDIREAVDKILAQASVLNDEELLERLDKDLRGLAALWADAAMRGNVVMPGSIIDILRHVAIQRGLMVPPDEEREHYAWIALELAREPGGLQ